MRRESPPIFADFIMKPIRPPRLLVEETLSNHEGDRTNHSLQD